MLKFASIFSLFSFSNEVETSTNDKVVPESNHASSPDTPVQIDFVDANDPVSFVGRRLTDDEKFSLLTSTLVLPKGYKIEAIGGRRFQESWTEERPWLRYSVSEQKAFCLSCICFGNFDSSDPKLSPFVSTGFSNWKKAVGKKESYLDRHMNSETHRDAEARVSGFLKTRQPGTDIEARLSKQTAEQQARAKKGLLSIIDVVIRLGMRAVALRGNWNKEENEEDVNFLFFVKWKATFDKALEDHLRHAPKNAKFTSPRIQNEIVSICENIIRYRIISKIPRYWSVMADETTDVSSTEQMSICIRFVNENAEVCEEFLGFRKLKKMDAQSVFDVLIPALKNWGLDLSNLVGQGYDGASVMSGNKNGLHKKVSDHYPNATYVHCRSHVLNLAIAGACKDVESVRDLFDNVGKITSFLGDGAKRKEIFKETVASGSDKELVALLTETENENENDDSATYEEVDKDLQASNQGIQAGARKILVPKLCPTRWSSRVETLSALMAKYPAVLETLGIIAAHSNGEPRSNAQSYIRLLEDPQFIVALVVGQYILSFTAPVTKVLQAKDCNLGEAYADVNTAKECIRASRTDEVWEKVWKRIESIANVIGVEVRKPRVACIQRHRANAGHSRDQSSSDYFKINFFYPFIDHVVEELETRFANAHEGLIAAQSLVPTYLSGMTNEKVKSLMDYYGKFLTFLERASLETEICRWKQQFTAMLPKDKQKTANHALVQCSARFYPAINKILTIFLTVPVGSVSCERSFSGLRRLKLWTRASMSQDRLSGLAMLMIHRGSEFIPSPQEVYEKKVNWRVMNE